MPNELDPIVHGQLKAILAATGVDDFGHSHKTLLGLREALISGGIDRFQEGYRLHRIEGPGLYAFRIADPHPRFETVIPRILKHTIGNISSASFSFETLLPDGRFVPAKIEPEPWPKKLTPRSYLLDLRGKHYVMSYRKEEAEASFMIRDTDRVIVANASRKKRLITASSLTDQDKRDGHLYMEWKILEDGIMSGEIDFTGMYFGAPVSELVLYLNRLFSRRDHSIALFRRTEQMEEWTEG